MIVAHSSRQDSVTIAHSSRQDSDLDVGIQSNIRNSDLTGQIPVYCWNERSSDACVRACLSGRAVMQAGQSKTPSGGANSVGSILSLKGIRLGSQGNSSGG